MKSRWIRRPVPTPINAVSVWEHTPLRPYVSEYPRFIRPPRDECRIAVIDAAIKQEHADADRQR